MRHQRRPYLKKVVGRPFAIIQSTSERVCHADVCDFITTGRNREFLAELKREHGVSRKAIAKIIRDTYDQAALVTEIMGATGGNELDPQGKKIVGAYSRAITALGKLLGDESLDRGFKGARPGRTLTTRDCIQEDIDYLKEKRREWAGLYLVYGEWPLWADARPAMTTMLRDQAAILHLYLTRCIKRPTQGQHLAIYRLLSELLRAIYCHPSFGGRRKLSAEAIKAMVDNSYRLGAKEEKRFRAFAAHILKSVNSP